MMTATGGQSDVQGRGGELWNGWPLEDEKARKQPPEGRKPFTYTGLLIPEAEDDAFMLLKPL